MGYTVKEYTFSDSNDLATVVTTAAAESDVIYLPTDNTVASNTEIIKNVQVFPQEFPSLPVKKASARAAELQPFPSATMTLDMQQAKWLMKSS